MKQLTLAGHPVHPQVIAFPFALLPFSAVMDVMHLRTGKRSYADAAYYSLVGGCASALVTVFTGAGDYVTIQSNTKQKQVANTHLALNGVAMALETANLLLRRRNSSGKLPALLGLLATGILGISQWYGGELSYKYGMRVQNAMGDNKRQGRFDRALERTLERAEDLMPASGPQF